MKNLLSISALLVLGILSSVQASSLRLKTSENSIGPNLWPSYPTPVNVILNNKTEDAYINRVLNNNAYLEELYKVGIRDVFQKRIFYHVTEEHTFYEVAFDGEKFATFWFKVPMVDAVNVVHQVNVSIRDYGFSKEPNVQWEHEDYPEANNPLYYNHQHVIKYVLWHPIKYDFRVIVMNTTLTQSVVDAAINESTKKENLFEYAGFPLQPFKVVKYKWDEVMISAEKMNYDLSIWIDLLESKKYAVAGITFTLDPVTEKFKKVVGPRYTVRNYDSMVKSII